MFVVDSADYICRECCKGRNDGCMQPNECFCDQACVGFRDCCQNFGQNCGNIPHLCPLQGEFVHNHAFKKLNTFRID